MIIHGVKQICHKCDFSETCQHVLLKPESSPYELLLPNNLYYPQSFCVANLFPVGIMRINCTKGENGHNQASWISVSDRNKDFEFVPIRQSVRADGFIFFDFIDCLGNLVQDIDLDVHATFHSADFVQEHMKENGFSCPLISATFCEEIMAQDDFTKDDEFDSIVRGMVMPRHNSRYFLRPFVSRPVYWPCSSAC